MKTTKNILALLLFIFLTHHGYSQQEMRFEHITVQDGLPENSVRQILQDYQGFLWFATQNGLVKYDGYKFTVFNYEPLDNHSIGGRNIFSLFEDKSKDIWIGTEFGLSKYDREKNWFDNFSLGDNITDRYYIFSICEDDYGYLYFGALGTGLYKFDKAKKSYTKFMHSPADSTSISSNSINGVFREDSSTIWIGTTDGGLNKFDIKEQTFKSYKFKAGDSNSINSNFICSVKKNRTGDLWIGTNRGLNKFNELTETFASFGISPGDSINLKEYEITNIYEDKNGILWLAVLFYGLVKFEPDTGRFIKYENDPRKAYTLNMNSVHSVFEDLSGVLWVGTIWGGLHKYDQRKSKFVHFTPNVVENNKSGTVVSFLKDSSGAIWVGTLSGLSRFDRNTNSFVNFSNVIGKKEKFTSNRITKLFMDSYGYFWIGTIDGLIKYDIKKKTISIYKHVAGDTISITGNFIRDIYEDRKNDLWIGTSTGLNVIDRKYNSFKAFLHNNNDSNSISDNEVLCIYEDSFDDLWIGTNMGGLNKLDRIRGSFIRYHYPRLGFTTLDPILEDNQGNLWIGAYQTGINMFDRNTGTIRSITEKEGLINNTISSMIKDNSGNLWVGTDCGLARFNPVTNNIKNFDNNDLPFTRFLTGGVMKDNEGYLYFGGDGGFIIFHPDSIKDNEHVPKIVLTEFMMFNKTVQPDENSPLKKNINVADKIELSYYDNSFSFEFAALDYRNPDRNQYAYMMEGFDKNWINSGNVRTVSYTNLDPGEYIFRVKGSNSDGVWNEEGASVKVIITPPWWKTWWFRGIGIILVIGLLGYVRQRKLSKIKNELIRQSEFTKQLINTQEAERKRIAGELHDSLGQKLLVIKNKLSLEMKTQKENPRLNELSGLTSDTLKEVRSISHNLHPYQLEQLGLTKAIDSILKSVSDAGKIIFRTDIDNIDSEFNQESEINIYRVIQECMNNILKHSSASEVDISMKKNNNILSILVFDNGKGFNSEDQQDIKEGRGIGLMGISERVRLLNGNFDIESSYGKGTRIQIDIPYSNLSEKDI